MTYRRRGNCHQHIIINSTLAIMYHYLDYRGHAISILLVMVRLLVYSRF